jgi:DNA-binding CsgD family transcriptional regulator
VLSEGSRLVALLAAAAAEPTLALLAAASNVDDPQAAISELVQAGVFVAAGDQIRFEHPLLASVAYSRGSDPERREVHTALAAVVTVPEERARHLALATPGPDASTAAALDEAADLAQARGAQAASGELRAWAAESTPSADVEARDRRLILAGQTTYMCGDTERAWELLEPVALAPGPSQHEALRWLGTLVSETTGWVAAREYWLAALATDDLELRVHLERSLALGAAHGGSVEAALMHSTRAIEAAERLGNTRLLAHALAMDGLIRTVGGDPRAAEVFAAAVALEPDNDSFDFEEDSLAILAADCARLSLDLEKARRAYARLRQLAVSQGDFRTEQWALYGGAHVAIDLGDLQLARELLEALDELTEQSGLRVRHALRLSARLAASQGNAEACRALTERSTEVGGPSGERLGDFAALAVVGRLELSQGDPQAAVQTLQALRPLTTELGVGLPGMLVHLVDEAEALASVGRLDDADAVLATFELRAQALDCVWARPLVDRTRGFIAAARGDLEEALRHLRAAEAAREDLHLPLERARIDLCLGRVLRRSKRRAEARESLDRAVTAFESLGSRLWAEQARAERARIGGRARPSGLTPTEAQVATLVAAGGSNKEVAAALFVTVNTVEAHLSRVYKKLGVRSRNQLARALAEHDPVASGLPVTEADA